MKTFSDILYQHLGHNIYFDLSKDQLNSIFDAMQAAVIQDRKNVADYAKIDCPRYSQMICKCDKNSIINAPHAKYS